jgi:hypothetical protein
MHVHISWATALIALLAWMVTVGALNLLARSRPGSSLSQAWSLISSAS